MMQSGRVQILINIKSLKDYIIALWIVSIKLIRMREQKHFLKEACQTYLEGLGDLWY
jgi:hypothetical protein